MSKTLDEFQREVGQWGQATFPQSKLLSIIRHFEEEARELVDAMEHPTKSIQEVDEEAADCFLLLLHYCHRRGVSLMALAEANKQVLILQPILIYPNKPADVAPTIRGLLPGFAGEVKR